MSLPRFRAMLLAALVVLFVFIFVPTKHAQAITYSLNVSSEYGTPNPNVGVSVYQSGVTVFCSVQEYIQLGDGVRAYCSGWTGTGSVPAPNSGISFHFEIGANSTVVWQWEEYYELVVQSANDINCIPAIGSHYYIAGANIDLGTPLFLKDLLFDGYQGSGVIASGSQHFLSISLTVPSTITWFYRASFLTSTPVFDESPVTVDDSPKVGKFSCLKINPNNGFPSISYFDEQNKNLMYAKYDGTDWDIVTVDDGILVGQYTKLVFDSAKSPIILYYSYGYRDLRIARKDIEGNWFTDIVDQDLEVGAYCDIVVLSGDRLGVSYYDMTNNNLLYRENQDGFWSPEPHLIVDDGGDGANTNVGTFSSIAVSPVNGEPSIAYRSETEDCVYYAYRESGTWNIQRITDVPGTGYFIDLAFDHNGVAHVVYQDFKNAPRTIDLVTAHRAGNVWYSEVVISSVDIGFYNSLAIDQYGYPHITTYDDSSLGLRYVMWNGRFWVSVLLDNDGDHVGRYSSLTLDSNGLPHVSYWADDTLRYIKASSWGTTQEEPPAPIVVDTAKSNGGGCFIATSAFGSYANDTVSDFCSIRDSVGASSTSGLNLIALYYQVSPEIAASLRVGTSLRAIVREILE